MLHAFACTCHHYDRHGERAPQSSLSLWQSIRQIHTSSSYFVVMWRRAWVLDLQFLLFIYLLLSDLRRIFNRSSRECACVFLKDSQFIAIFSVKTIREHNSTWYKRTCFLETLTKKSAGVWCVLPLSFPEHLLHIRSISSSNRDLSVAMKCAYPVILLSRT